MTLTEVPVNQKRVNVNIQYRWCHMTVLSKSHQVKSRKKGRWRGKRKSSLRLIQGYVCVWRIKYIDRQVGNRHGQGSIREFENDTNAPAFLKMELMGFGVDGYGRSEFMIVQVVWCPFLYFENI